MITIENVQFSYKKNQSLFEGLNLELERGKIYGLLGKNGTGKSSLLKLMVGALHPQAGKINIDDNISEERRPEMLEDIFFLSEDYLLPSIGVESYVKAYSPFYQRFDRQRFDEILNIFEVPLEQKLTNLSLGQKKKFIIAFGIATNARYLLLDEPTNGLDIPSKSQFRKVLASGFRDDQIVIISTHQIRDLGNLIEAVVMIDNGKIILSKDVFEIGEKLLFVKSLSSDNKGESIYSEMVAGGYIHMLPNTNNESSEIELEVLFNAITSQNDLIQKYL